MSLTKLLINLSPKVPMTRMGMVRRELKAFNFGDILDLGCGDGNSTKMILGSMAHKFTVTGIDAHPESLEKARHSGIYHMSWVADIRQYMNGLDNSRFLETSANAYDIILLCEVLEHLTKEDGHKLLETLDHFADYLIIITTPAYSDLDPHVKRDEPIESRIERGEFWRVPHISVWSKQEFEQHGYTVRGANGLRIPSLPYLPRMILGMLLTPFIWKSPNRANTIVAVKRF